MKLRVRLFAGLAERAGLREIVVDDPRERMTLAELKALLEARHPALGSLGHVSGVVGTSYAPDDRVLVSGDDVALLPPVSGGEPDRAADLERGLFELSLEPLDAALAAQRVGHPACGAIASFVGTTRDKNRGLPVVRLEYEAFEAMTGPEMARIFERAHADLAHAAAPDIDTAPASRARTHVRMLVQHRVGVVEIGQPSVVIAVASPHRAAAFRACRFLIDELKKSLPIWKKEIYADGHHWIGDRS